MYKTILVLRDGTEISSGTLHSNAVQSIKITQMVNDSQELTIGSACAAMVEVKLSTPTGAVPIVAGDTFTVYRQDDKGTRHKVGVFIAEKPTHPSANTVSITAYDRVSKLDKDLSIWLASLEGWPYTLLNFSKMVCEACGLTLSNTSIPNGDFQVKAFTGQEVTGRRLIQWAGQIAGRFCRATADGNLEFAWYTPNSTVLTPEGERFFFQNGLSYADYQVAPIEKVHICLTQDDVGAVWPDTEGEKNTYTISGNFLLTDTDTATLQGLAQNLCTQLQGVTYTPCKVQIPACMDIRAGDILPIRDRNGREVRTYVMTKTQTGQRDTLEATGSQRRDSSEARNNEDYRAINNKLMELRKDADGLSLKVSEQSSDVDALREAVTNVQIGADGLSAQITELQQSNSQAVEDLNGEIETLRQSLSVKMDAAGVQLQIEEALENGTDKVVTSTGFSFDEIGLTVEKSDSEMKTQITENGMTVCQNGQEVLVANNNGVDAKNLHATTYLIVGANSRFEDYGSDRTGCFWIGG